jgi:hypothetical protein
VSIPVTDAARWQKICGSGIARSADLQRAQAVMRGRQSTVAQSQVIDDILSAKDMVSATDPGSHL